MTTLYSNKNFILNYGKTYGLQVHSGLVSSCSSTNTLTLSVMEPAPVHISSKIKKIGVVNRSKAKKSNPNMDKIEKILSVEGKNLDRDGASEAISGLFNELSTNKRFTEIKGISDDALRTPGAGIYPAPLSWRMVNKLCNENNVDVLFVLSFYDTDTKVDYKAVDIEIDGPGDTKIPGVEHHAKVETFMKAGWRIYDPANSQIMDEYQTRDKVTLKGVGINPMKAVQAMIGRREAVLNSSRNMGDKYGRRIHAYSRRVSRQYYVKGTNNFEVGKRRAQTGNWDGAAELWEKELNNSDSKIAGRACYNMAIINEINGDLDKAVDWASKSYSDYENKKALGYLNILRNRIEKNIELERQSMN